MAASMEMYTTAPPPSTSSSSSSSSPTRHVHLQMDCGTRGPVGLSSRQMSKSCRWGWGWGRALQSQPLRPAICIIHLNPHTTQPCLALHSQAKALSCTRSARQAAAEREQRGMGSADTVAEVVGGAGASSVAAAMGSATESAAEMEVDPAVDGTAASSTPPQEGKKRKGGRLSRRCLAAVWPLSGQAVRGRCLAAV
eukprot:4798417-Prymnesium_polylepis.1